ncbi:elongation of very long chain fatty acids protein 1 [Monomorium pharaonis]|uniref:elongation of very long chain fatty acids protein 1 n=1 Tax=Monomorium pharaonis TaxID=307658 RepID=UPI00102E1BBF|nr:elongation of very long chain fatty acids protein 1 [Monomorium pharaonis]
MAQVESNHYIPEKMANFTDAQIIKWPFLSSPIPIIFISLVYIYIVYFIGPQFMRNRQPYSLKTFMQCYNFFQIIANSWLVFNIVTTGGSFDAIWRYCEPFDKLYANNTEKQLGNLWWTLLLKIIDFIETIVFILRKKDRQISYLHTYHHVTVVIHVWLTLRYFIVSFAMTATVVNSSIHVIMYSYYFLSTFGPDMQQRLLPFKKNFTVIQMVQFIIFLLIGVQGLMPNCDNKNMIYFSAISFINVMINLLFFLNFYISSYKKSKKSI